MRILFALFDVTILRPLLAEHFEGPRPVLTGFPIFLGSYAPPPSKCNYSDTVCVPVNHKQHLNVCYPYNAIRLQFQVPRAIAYIVSPFYPI